MDGKEDYEKREAALIAEFAKLMKKGFPEKEMAQWDAKVAVLPEDYRIEVKELTHISETLKSALSGRGHYRTRG
jgi:hypothetical protein